MRTILTPSIIFITMVHFTVFAAQKNEKVSPTPAAAENEKDFGCDLSTSAEVYYFAVKSNMEKEEDSLDFSQSKYRLKYKIDPVFMAAFHAGAYWKFLSFAGDYKTDRVFRRGGSVEQGEDVASKLTENKTASEILQLGIGIFDLKTSFRTVQFDSGTVYVLDNKTNDHKSSGQMKLNIITVDIMYEFHPLGKNFPLSIAPGYRFMDYRIPRIVYRFEDTTPGDTDTWVYKDETEPQEIRTRSHMGGFLTDFGPKAQGGKYALICAAGMYLGPNRTKFSLGDSEKNPMLFTIAGNFKLGGSIRLFDSLAKADLRIMYDLNVINTSSAETNNTVNGKQSESTVKYVFGSTDYYHAFTVAFAAAF